MNAHEDDSQVRFESALFSEKNKIFHVPLWKGQVPESSVIDLKLNLKPGANIITLSSQGDESSSPWFYVWKVRIK